MKNRMGMFVGVAVSLLVFPAAGYAESERQGGTDVRLYEISERVTFDPKSLDGTFVVFRNATSPLLGFAELGTPLCPSALLISFPQMERCTVIAAGTDSVSTVTGTGPVNGTFDVVINAPGNSSVHVPDLPVLSGTFIGTVNLSNAILSGVPLGSLDGGSLTYTHVADLNGALVPFAGCPLQCPTSQFSGTFRLPFAIDRHGRAEKSDHKRTAFYLADDFKTLILIQSNERSIGFPTVRLELSFP